MNCNTTHYRANSSSVPGDPTYFAHSADLLARSAQALGKREEAARHRELFERVRRAFQLAYVDDEGVVHGDTQCGYVLALAFDLLEGPRREQAARRLVEDVQRHGGHLTTGFIGTKDLMLALSKVGRDDVAYELLFNTSYPSWGFSIRQGATSIWERWDGWTPEAGFNDPGMNSFAHYSFGAVGQWMFETIGGIRTDGPAFRRIVVAPRPPSTLERASASYDSVRGRIESRWVRRGGALELEVLVPPNTTASVRVPSLAPERVTESGRPARSAAGVRAFRTADGEAVIEVGSGRYRFATDAARLVVPAAAPEPAEAGSSR